MKKCLRDVSIFTGLAVLTCLPASFFACSGTDSVSRGGTVIIGETSDYESLNPLQTSDAHARDVYKQLFLLLLDENSDLLTFSPRLAESWILSEDRKQLTFNLRDDVFWSDGVKVTAGDVKATFKVQTDPEIVWPSRHLKNHIDSVSVIDDYTVTYHFNHIYPYQVMDAVDGPILPAHLLEKYTPEQLKALPIEEFPVNGPFRIGEWIKGQTLTLVRNETYYDDERPYLDRVIFKIVPDQLTLITQLKVGEIDAMEATQPSEVAGLRSDYPQLAIIEYDSRGYGYIGWNGLREPFDNPRIRTALTHSINRQKIIDNVFYGLAKECVGPFPPIIWAHDPEMQPLAYDPELARKIFAEEGYVDSDGDGYLELNGEPFEFELLTNQGNQIRADIQIMVQEALREVGVRVTPVALEWTVFLSKYKANEFDAVVSAWRASTKADLSPIWACESRGSTGYNRVDYCNPEVDSLNTLATSILDFDEARPIFYRAQRIIYEEQPYTFVYVPSGILVLSRRFSGAKPDAISSIHNIYDWRIEE